MTPTDPPPEPPRADPTAIRQALNAIQTDLTEAEQAAAAGAPVALAELEARSRAALDALVRLPADQARALAPRLETMIATLDRLDGHMRAQQAALAGEAASGDGDGES